MGLSRRQTPGKNKELRQRGDDLNNPRHANVSGILTERRSVKVVGGKREGDDSLGEKKKNERTRQSANLHTMHTGEEEPHPLAFLEGMIALSR